MNRPGSGTQLAKTKLPTPTKGSTRALSSERKKRSEVLLIEDKKKLNSTKENELPDVFYTVKDVEKEMKELSELHKEMSKVRPTKISATLVSEKNLLEKPNGEEEFFNKLFSLTHLRLDRCNIAVIENIELYSNVTHIYLQYVGNFIIIINNLNFKNNIKELSHEFKFLPNLRFLALFNNKIQRIDDELKENEKLQYLDVSNNDITFIDFNALPKSLSILNLLNNSLNQGLEKETALEIFPNLVQLNEEYLEQRVNDFGITLTNSKETESEEDKLDQLTVQQLRKSQTGENLLQIITKIKSDAEEDEEEQDEMELAPIDRSYYEASIANYVRTTEEAYAKNLKFAEDEIEKHQKHLDEQINSLKLEFESKRNIMLEECRKRKEEIRSKRKTLQSPTSDDSINNNTNDGEVITD
ncbi:hypothetical protein ABK040_006481 [Willaertia magna]